MKFFWGRVEWSNEGAADWLSAPVDSMGFKWWRLTGQVARCGVRPLMTREILK